MFKRPFCGMAAGILLGIAATAYGADGLLFLAAAGVCLYAFCRIKKGIAGREKKAGWNKRLFRLCLCALALLLGRGRFLQEEQYRAAYLPFLENGMQLTVQGKLTGKQIKNQQYVYELGSCMIGPDQNKFLSAEPVPCNRILVYSDTDAYSIGQILVADGTVELWESASNEGNFDAKAFYETRRIDFKLRDVSVRAAYGKQGGAAEKLWQLRLRLATVYQETMREKEAGVMTTMTTGGKELLDEDVKRLYQTGGMSHILAISGLHISLIGMTLYRILRKTGLSFAGAGISAGILMCGYGVMVGSGVSVQRSVLMFLLFLAAQAAGRSYDTLNALGAAAVFLLLNNPYLLWDAGFQFSFAAVLGVVWVGGSVSFQGERLEKWKAKIFTGVVIQLVTLPLAAWYYYEIPVYATAVNLAVLPLMGAVLGLGVTGGLTGLVSVRAAKFLLVPCQALLGLVEWICGLVSGLPSAMWITGRPDIARVFLYYGMLAVFTVCAYRRKERERSAGTRNTFVGKEEEKTVPAAGAKTVATSGTETVPVSGAKTVPVSGAKTMPVSGVKTVFVSGEKTVPVSGVKTAADRKAAESRTAAIFAAAARIWGKRRTRLLAAAALLIAVLCVPGSGGLELDVLDVGQGDGIFLRTEEGCNVFVDGGSSNVGKVGQYRILPFLKYKGARRIDCWFVSHADEDHISGLREILEADYPVRRLVFAEGIVRDAAWEELVSLAGEAGTEIIYMNGGDVLNLGGAKLTAIYPVCATETGEAAGDISDRNKTSVESGTADRNESSLVILYEEGDFSGIFTGDVGSGQEHQIAETLRERASAEGGEAAVDFYKAAHHGSRYSNSEELLSVLKPEIAVVSCAEKNRYGHPSAEAVSRMEEAGCSVFYTMESGQIKIRPGEETEVIAP